MLDGEEKYYIIKEFSLFNSKKIFWEKNITKIFGLMQILMPVPWFIDIKDNGVIGKIF